jgi:hypothetical protein
MPTGIKALNLRFTAEEFGELKQKKQASGMNWEDWIRSIADDVVQDASDDLITNILEPDQLVALDTIAAQMEMERNVLLRYWIDKAIEKTSHSCLAGSDETVR